MGGPGSSPERQSGGGALGTSPLGRAASVRPSRSLVLYGSFLEADSDVVPSGHPMSEVIFEEEQSSDVTVFVSRETKHNYGLSRPLLPQESPTLPSLCWLD